MGISSRVVLALALVLGSAFLLQPYRPVVVRGGSMLPTFQDWQIATAERPDRAPKVGDVVVFEKDGATLIKRVAMVEGDSYIEAYLWRAKTWQRVTTPAMRRMVKKHLLKSREVKICKGYVYVLGDNPELSVDSRTFGPIPFSSIKGFVFTA